MIDYNKIYQISESGSNKPFRGVIEGFELSEPEISRGERIIDVTIPIKHSMGGKILYDIIWTTNAFPFIVSEKVINLFRENAITGWKTYNVNIYSKKAELIKEKFFGLVITGRCGYLDYSRSPVVMDKIGIMEEPHIKGFNFKTDFWDGSDLFMCQPDKEENINMNRFCTEKVVQLMKKEKIKNISFEKTTDFTMSISLYNIELTEKQNIEIEKLKASR